MKLFFDQNLSFKLPAQLADIFPESTQAKLLGMERDDDVRVWKFAKEHGYTIVTQDSDFYQLSLLHGLPPKVIWLRCGNRPTQFIADLLRGSYDDILNFMADEALSCLIIY